MGENIKKDEELLEEQETVAEETAEETAEEAAEETAEEAAEELPVAVIAAPQKIKKRNGVNIFIIILLVISILAGAVVGYLQHREIKKLQSRIDDIELVLHYGAFGEEVSVVADYFEEQLKMMEQSETEAEK